MKTSIFIVDDHYMVIEGIRSLLQHEKNIAWLGHATNAGSCMAFLKGQQPDVILMDISMPDKSGIDLCRQVKEKYPSISILGLSTFNQQSFIQKMVDNGALGYLLKNASKEELLEAIEAVNKGQKYFSGEVVETLKLSQNIVAPILTRREKEVLELIVDGMTNNEIAEKLFVSVTTISSHRKNLLTKLAAKNTAALVRIATQLRF